VETNQKKETKMNKIISNKNGCSGDRGTTFGSYEPCTYRVEDSSGNQIGYIETALVRPWPNAPRPVSNWAFYIFDQNDGLLETKYFCYLREARAFAKTWKI